MRISSQQRKQPRAQRAVGRLLSIGALTAAVAAGVSVGSPAIAAPIPGLGAVRTSTDIDRAVVELTNAARAVGRNCGTTYYPPAGPLTVNETLAGVALAQSTDMAVRGYFSHDNPDGVGPFQRIAAAGYQYTSAGENIAAGYTDPQAVMEGWLNSPGHCRNIMNPSFTEIGVGYYRVETLYRDYWSQEFGSQAVGWTATDDDHEVADQPTSQPSTQATGASTQSQAVAGSEQAAVATTARLVSVKRNKAKVSWSDVDAAEGYQVRLVRPTGPGKVLTTTAHSRTFSGLKRHTSYTVQIVPVLETGQGETASITFTTR